MRYTVGKFFMLSLPVSRRRILTSVFSASGLAFFIVFDEAIISITGIPAPFLLLSTIVFAGIFAGSVLKIALLSNYRRRKKIQPGDKDNFVIGVDAATNLIIILVTIGSIFPVFGVPFGTFLTSISVFSVALVWLFKEYISNFMDSFRLMFSADFLIGDYIKLSDTSKGVITDITFRATKLKTDEGDVLFIPNTTLMSTEVTNYSKVRYKRIMVKFSLPTARVGSVSKLETVLTKEADEVCKENIDTARTFLRIVGVSKGHTDFSFEVSVNNYNFKVEDQVQRAVYERVVDYSRRLEEGRSKS